MTSMKGAIGVGEGCGNGISFFRHTTKIANKKGTVARPFPVQVELNLFFHNIELCSFTVFKCNVENVKTRLQCVDVNVVLTSCKV